MFRDSTRTISAGLVSGKARLSFDIEGEIFEVLEGCGLASILSSSDAIYTVDRETPGLTFADLRPGQFVRCTVDCEFERVLHAGLIG